MKYISLILVLISFVGCSWKIKTDNGSLIHEDLYQIPLLHNTSWVRSIPAGKADALYLRCPNEQRIAIAYTMICGHWNYDEMTSEDYANRIYLNRYWKFGRNLFCPPSTISPLTDKNFKRFVKDPLVNKEKKTFEILYESTWEGRVCGSDEKIPLKMKIMDVFMQEPKFHFRGGANTRFVVMRYASPEDQFESGLDDFKSIVTKFEWTETEE